VPTDYGLRSDDCKCAIHLGKQSADASQYQPVNRHKSKSLRISASQHIDLLPQHQNLCLKRNLRPRQVAGNPKDQSTQIEHRVPASRDSQSTASTIEFTTGTGVCAAPEAGSAIAPSNNSPVVLNCMIASQVQRIIGAPYPLPTALGMAGRFELLSDGNRERRSSETEFVTVGVN
jgi:hypothetical protein